MAEDGQDVAAQGTATAGASEQGATAGVAEQGTTADAAEQGTTADAAEQGATADVAARGAAAAQHIVAVAFDKLTRADEVLLSMLHLKQEDAVDLADAAVVTKDQNGKVRLRQTIDVSPGQGAMSGSWWGLLIGLLIGGPLVGAVAGAATGALYGKLVDIGLNDNWMKEAGDTLGNGTSAIFVLINSLRMPDVLRELSRFEGRVIYTDFPDEARAELEQALRMKDWQKPATEV